MEEMNCPDIKDEPNDAQYLENGGAHLVKVEDIEISEQFVDESEVYDRREYVAKYEDSNSSEQNYAINLKNHRCQLCEFASDSKDALKLHIVSIHLNSEVHECHQCDFVATRKSSFKLHTDWVHLNLKPHKCHLCEYTSNWKANLKSHINSVHLNLKPHKCQLCEYASNQKKYLKRHMESKH